MGKHMRLFLLVLGVVILGSMAISEKTPGSYNSPKIAYVDMDMLLRSNREWIEFNKNMQSDREFYQRQLNNMSREYNEMKEAGVSEGILKEKEQEIYERKSDFEETLNSTYTTKYEIIAGRINKHLKNFAAYNGYDVIITSSAVIYGTVGYDITAALIAYIEANS